MFWSDRGRQLLDLTWLHENKTVYCTIRYHINSLHVIPKHSMDAIYANIGVVWGVNVAIYGIHGVSGIYMLVIIWYGRYGVL